MKHMAMMISSENLTERAHPSSRARLTRLLLYHDGSTIRLLELLADRKVQVAIRTRYVTGATRDDDRLQVRAGDVLLVREVDLSAGGAKVARARAVIPFDHVPAAIGAALEAGIDAIGPLLRASRLEHFREIPEATQIEDDRVTRQYRIFHGQRPIADISEQFNLPALEHLCGRED